MGAVRIGIAGTGAIASVMAKTLCMMKASGDGSATLAAVASRDVARARAFVNDNGCGDAKTFGSYAEMAASGAIDMAYIAVPNQAHIAVATEFLRHGIACLVEKPFCVNIKEAQELYKCADDHKALATEGIWTRYQPMRSMIGDAIKSGIIGAPMFAEANLSYEIASKERIVRPDYAGGALLDLGVYVLNFAIMAFGHPDDAECTCIRNADGCDMSDSISLTFPGGRMASLNVSAMCQGHRRGAVFGRRGYLEVDNVNNPQILRIYGPKYELLDERSAPAQLTGFEYEVREAAKCFNDGLSECPSMPRSETLYVQGLMDSLRAQCGVRFPMERQ
jgi:predicted dehydrogenase